MEQEERNWKAEPTQELLLQLETWLDVYDRVFLISEEIKTAGNLTSGILQAGAGMTEGRSVLILSTAPLEIVTGFTYKQITMEEQEQLLQLYHMYEFSDRFSVILTESTYGSLFNLVEAGLLDMEEAAEALFVYG